MQYSSNRWLTSALLLGFFAIIGVAAGRQGAPTTTNVLVTNTTQQAVPVKIASSVATPINVNESTHGKDGLQLSQLLTINTGTSNNIITFNSIPGERFVITHFSVEMTSVDSDSLTGLFVSLVDSHNTQIYQNFFSLDTKTVQSFLMSYLNTPVLMYLDPGQSIHVSGYRVGNGTEQAYVTLSGYRVSYP
jgi:hypothetical protein